MYASISIFSLSTPESFFNKLGIRVKKKKKKSTEELQPNFSEAWSKHFALMGLVIASTAQRNWDK